MGKRSEKNTILLLQSVAATSIEVDKIKERLRLIRQEVERLVWNEQGTSPHLIRSIEDLELSMEATKCVPPDVKTIGDLCQHSAMELLENGSKRYLREIEDSLRSLALVLKPSV